MDVFCLAALNRARIFGAFGKIRTIRTAGRLMGGGVAKNGLARQGVRVSITRSYQILAIFVDVSYLYISTYVDT